MTNTVIAELTGLSDSHVSDALKSLADRKIIFSQKQDVMKTVGINTDLSAWILDKPKTGNTFPETVDTQDYNKNNNKISSSRNSDESRIPKPENSKVSLTPSRSCRRDIHPGR